MSKKRWKKTKIALIVLAALVVGFFAVFNTSTRYGRWLYWQDIDWGDMDRFAHRTVENDPNAVHSFASNQASDAVREVVTDFRIDGESLQEFAASHDSTALVVVHDDEVLLEKYFRDNEQDSFQYSVSCTKSLVSLLVGIAIDKGMIESVDDPITEYVDGLHSDFDDVSIRHLLTMTSGTSDSDDELFGVAPAPWSDRVKSYYDPNLRRLARSFKRDYEPGARFEYHDFNPILVGLLLENVSDMTLSGLLSETIWQPAGMQYSGRWSLDSRRHGFEKPESGFHARAIDFARLGAHLIDSDQELVSRQWLETSVHDERASQLLQERLAASADRAESRGAKDLAEHIRALRYGYYWWGIERLGRYDYYANGHFGQFIYISPEAELVIVRHGTGHGGLNDWYFGMYFFDLASAVIKAKARENDTQSSLQVTGADSNAPAKSARGME